MSAVVVKLVSLQLLHASAMLWQSEPSLGPYLVPGIPDLVPKNINELIPVLERQVQSAAAVSTAPPTVPGSLSSSVPQASATPGATAPEVPVPGAVTPGSPAVATPTSAVSTAGVVPPPAAAKPVPVPAAAPGAAVAGAPPVHPPHAAGAPVKAAAPARHKRDVGDVIHNIGAAASVAGEVAESAIHAAATELAEQTTDANSLTPPDVQLARRRRDLSGIVSEVADTSADVLEHVSRNSPFGGRISGSLADASRDVQFAMETPEQRIGRLLVQ